MTTSRPPHFLPSRFRWCLSTLGCAELDLAETTALAADYGVRELELRALKDRLDLPVYLAETFGQPDRLKAELEVAAVRITVLDTSLSLVGSDEEARKAFLSFIPWAEALNIPFLRVFDGGQLVGDPDPGAVSEARETIQWWQQLRRKNGWRTDIVMETHDAFCRANACLALEQSLSEPLSILWDAHHTWHKAGEAIEETWAALRPFIRHIHFKDSVPEANAVNDYTCTIPGQGRFPLHPLFHLLEKDGYNGALCFEWERKWQTSIPPVSDALAGLASFLSSAR